MKTKLILSTFIVLFCLSYSYGQIRADDYSKLNPETKDHALYFDLGGWAFGYSLNYEYRLSLSERNRLAFGAGISLFSISNDEELGLVGGVKAVWLYGRKHNLETALIPYVNTSTEHFIPSVWLGYRYEGTKGFLFRAGANASLLFFDSNNIVPFPWPGISFGYAF